METFPELAMGIALDVAKQSAGDDLPIAAIITDSSGSLILSACNAVVQSGDPLAHAEMLALRELSSYHLRETRSELTLLVTLEPCPMCAWAIRAAGIGKLIFGAYNPNYGAAGTVFDLLRDGRFGKSVEVLGGVLLGECEELLKSAFTQIRHNVSR